MARPLPEGHRAGARLRTSRPTRRPARTAATAPVPYTAPDWASIAPGEIRLLDDGGPQTVDPNGGDPAVGATFNPLGATACSTAPGAEEPGTADYELPAAPAGGYTVMGAATVIANINLPGDNSQIAARLVDVSPDGTTKTLVERGLWRPRKQGPQVFQLFANGWKVEEGHVLRLELLPRDAAQKAPGGFLSNYGRPSNGQQAATIDNVDLRVPVLEAPGSLGGMVTDPAPKVLPKRAGVELAPGYGSVGAVAIRGDLALTGKPVVKGKRLRVKMTCDGDANYSCHKARLKLKGAPKGKKARGKNAVLARGKDIRVAAGETEKAEAEADEAGSEAVRRPPRRPQAPHRGADRRRVRRLHDDEAGRQGEVGPRPGGGRVRRGRLSTPRASFLARGRRRGVIRPR